MKVILLNLLMNELINVTVPFMLNIQKCLYLTDFKFMKVIPHFVHFTK